MADGERGDRGDRGVGGERGPKGDHGQHGDAGVAGDQGQRGPQGERGERGLPARLDWVSKHAVSMILVLITIGVIQTFVIVALYTQEVDLRTQLSSQGLRNCERGNINSGRVTLIAHTPQAKHIARNLYPIVDCSASQKLQERVPIKPAEAKKYVALIGHARAPIVVHGKVVGARPTLGP